MRNGETLPGIFPSPIEIRVPDSKATAVPDRIGSINLGFKAKALPQNCPPTRLNRKG